MIASQGSVAYMRDYSFPPRPKRGDLVTVRANPRDPTVKTTIIGAIVLEYYDANVYESACCQLLHDGDIFWADVKNITVITDEEDVKKA